MDRCAASDSARLFFAAVPNVGTAERIHRLAGVLKRAHKFDGKLIPPERLHISLFFLGGWLERHIHAPEGKILYESARLQQNTANGGLSGAARPEALG